MQFPDYPIELSSYTSINGCRMHYLEGGKDHSETVVMLHGNPSWSFYYRHLFSALINNYHCIVPDHIGMGLSDKPVKSKYEFTLKQRVDDLDTLLSSLGVDNNLTLIVHDWGGMIGMAYATRYPDKIKRLVISNTAGFHIPEGRQVPWQLKLSRTPLIGSFLIQGLNAFCRGGVIQCVTRKAMDKEVKNAYLAPYDSWAHRFSVLRFVEDIPLDKMHPTYDMVEQVDKNLQQFEKVPMLVCWGLNDFVFDVHYLNEWKKRMPDAEYHEYDAGHYLLEDAANEVIPVIQKFLKSNPVE
ncbi:MAG: alpha/beta fold hydrolase [Proteobacteria bacterium]|nr:alpha/beta fold hydrolase [Pseudomonadota bacterium]NOG59494.1 alpha/beta fold hydrolase [Pseudomonadota bacterium]